MDEQDHRVAYRVRTAETGDDAALRASIGATLAHPDGQGRRESYRGAASKGDLLVLEHYDRQEREWHIAGFVECHMRVDDSLTIRDIGTSGNEPQTGVVRYLLDDVFSSFHPQTAQIKIRRDAEVWRDLVGSLPGFHLEGEEYRRPHYWGVWVWDRQRQEEELRAARQPQRRDPPRPPRPPTPPSSTNGSRPFPRPAEREGGYSGNRDRGRGNSGPLPRAGQPRRPSGGPGRSPGPGPRGSGPPPRKPR
jgi:hypothetical protein